MPIIRNSTHQKVDIHIWHRIHQVLIDARENSQELLEDTIKTANGTEHQTLSKKEKAIIDVYDAEIREFDSLLEYTIENNGVPF